jgi:hypothetical protein
MPVADLKTDHPIALRCALEWLPVRAAAAAAEAEKVDKRDRRYRMVAYTGGIASIGYYGRSVFDFDTMDIGPQAKTPNLRDHDPGKIIGFAEQRAVEKVAATEGAEALPGLVCEGVLLGGLNEHADEVIEAAERGFPWQASVWLQPGTIEWVEAGTDLTVNGRTLSGPFVLHRNTRLKEISFLPLGGDPDTSAEVAKAAANGGTMSTKTSPALAAQLAAAAAPVSPPAAESPATPPPVQAAAPAAPAAPAVAPARAELGELLAEAPGHEGLVASMFAKGDTAQAIRAAVAAKTREALAAKDAEIAQLRAQVAQPGIGFNAAARQAGDPKAAAPAGAATAEVGADPLRASAQAVWDKKPELRAQFGHRFEWYLAECRSTGRVEE